MNINATTTYRSISTHSEQNKVSETGARKDVNAQRKPEARENESPSNSTTQNAANANNVKNYSTEREERRTERNAEILQAHHEASLSSRNEPLSLLYKTALEALRQELEPILGGKTIEEAHENGLDTSPEATAERIVSLSTGFFSRFKEQNPELTAQEQIVSFSEIVSKGIDKGFSEAREILDGLKVLKEGDIAENIDKTYELVQQGLQDFRENQLQTNLSNTKISEPDL
ncbi:MAG: hypothetical protein ACI89U_000073 [Gammaproteobacteria bacterium]|jgi:hypothetical protein